MADSTTICRPMNPAIFKSQNCGSSTMPDQRRYCLGGPVLSDRGKALLFGVALGVLFWTIVLKRIIG
jgi:hypothetical protein